MGRTKIIDSKKGVDVRIESAKRDERMYGIDMERGMDWKNGLEISTGLYNGLSLVLKRPQTRLLRQCLRVCSIHVSRTSR